MLEKRLTTFATNSNKPITKDIEEALLQAILSGADEAISPLILAGARRSVTSHIVFLLSSDLFLIRLDCALYLAIQLERLKAIAMLLLCKGTITGDCQAIRSLLSEPADSENSPWFMADVHDLLSQGTVKMYCPIAVSIMVKNYDATRELLLRTDLDMRRKQVDWGRLKLTVLHESWIYSIAPWVVNLKLGNNNLRKLPSQFLTSTQLRRLDLSSNLLEKLTVDLFSLPNVEWLNLSHNKLKELSDATVWSRALINLDLSHNYLKSLPSSIQTSMLEILQLSHNKFTTVPKCVCRIHSLTTLDLSSMPITSLPSEMEFLDKLANLNVTNCNISDLPQGNVPFGPRSIRALIRSRARSNKSCNYIKLVVLCNSSIGKTVMYSRLRQTISPPGSHLPDMEMFQWSHRPFKFFGLQKLIFNTWMIGVQRDFRFLYHCLYTPSALYALVWDMTRTGDMREQLKPYIDGICRRLPNANVMVIIILPEPFDHWADANTGNLTKRINFIFSQPAYQSLQFHGIHLLSNSPNSREAQVDIRMKIYDIASTMTVNSTTVTSRQYPENYFNLIPVIEKEHTSLKAEGRPGIMEEGTLWSMFESTLGSDMPDSMELPVVSGFLLEAGYLMHFEDPNLRLEQHYFLHPEWVINTIHNLLKHLHHHCALRPIVSYSKVRTQLKEPTFTPALIRLMVRFAILLPVSQKEYLIPSLLPHNPRPLAMLQVGCHRRQFIPKSKSFPDEFWYYMITNILFHLPRLLAYKEPTTMKLPVTDTGQEGNRRLLSPLSFVSDGEESNLSTPVGLSISSLSPLENDPHPFVAMGTTKSNKEEVFELESKPLSKNEEGMLRPRAKGLTQDSPTKMSNRASGDPVEILPGIFVWRSGIQIMKDDDMRIAVYPQSSDLGLEESGIEVCSSNGEKGRWVMARVCWLIQKLLHQRYPEFSPELQLSSNYGLTQLILCPSCMKDEYYSTRGGGATNFIIETCFVALKELEMSSHTCHHHPDPIAMEDLIPEYLMVDLPTSLYLLPDKFTYQDSRPIYREATILLCDGMHGKEPVTVKMHIINETKSYSVPLSALRQEIEMLTHLNHPNIIRTLGFCLSPPLILLEKSPLGTLLQKLNDNEQQISRLARFHIAKQVVSALAYLHKNGIIYRTLKSDSILTWSLDFEDEISIKLAHFDRAAYSTPSGLIGKIESSSYPAPEMVKYDYREEYTEKVDIYSFGMLLYELVARWQPFTSDKATLIPKPKLTGLQTYGFQTLLKLMEQCSEEEANKRPSASHLTKLISNPMFQCHLSTQVLRDCVTVRGCTFIPSLRQLWAYGEYNITRAPGDLEASETVIEGTQVFILNTENLTVQGSLELKERANAISTVDSKVWIGMLEACIHVYDTNTFHFTDRIYVKDSVTFISTNDTYAFVGLANGMLTYYDKLSFPRESNTIKIGEKAIISMLPIGDFIWVSCGHEIVVLSAYDEITVLKRWQACQTNDQVYALVPSKENKSVWSIIRGSLIITCWDVCLGSLLYPVDLSDVLKNICDELMMEFINVRLLSLECSQNVLWLGVSTGIIVLLTATSKPEVITWFRAHRNAIRCLLEIPSLNREDFPVVISGGYGEESFIKTQSSWENGVIMSWQSLQSNDLQTVVRRKAYLDL